MRPLPSSAKAIFALFMLIFLIIFIQQNAVFAQENAPFYQAVQKWVDTEFQPSTLPKEEQINEMKWFTHASLPLRGTKIHVVSDGMAVHDYEANILAKAFEEMTGIKVAHHIINRSHLIENAETQLKTGRKIYDGYILPADMMGTLFRYDGMIPISTFIEDKTSPYLLPTMDLNDLIGKSMMTGPDNKLYQLPAQQYAVLYWFRHDWFSRWDLKAKFKEIYGYELGVPLNWAAYEDIAYFFSYHVKKIDGKVVYGHLDYGRNDPNLSYRFTDGWMALAGVGDRGIPKGLPVDDWGIRSENCRVKGTGVERGGAINSPAAVYALEKYIKWMKKYAPMDASEMTWDQGVDFAATGHVAQQIFWYTTYADKMLKEGLPVVGTNGTPKWRVAPPPLGIYHQNGMKKGYRGMSGWTFFKKTPEKQLKAAWLYAQFTISKTVSLKKALHGLSPIRKSDLFSSNMENASHKLGGLVEFYQSPLINQFSPASFNVVDYVKLSSVWWQNIASAISGEKTPQNALNTLAKQQDRILKRFSKSYDLKFCKPRLNKPRLPTFWYNKYGAPKAKLNEKTDRPQTVPYEEMLKILKGKPFPKSQTPPPFSISDF